MQITCYFETFNCLPSQHLITLTLSELSRSFFDRFSPGVKLYFYILTQKLEKGKKYTYGKGKD